MNKERKELAVFLLIPLAVGALSALFTRGSMKEFALLAKPPLAPAGWVFPVVWTILYVLMGIASWLVYREGTEKPAVTQALRLYAIQLAFNFLWPIFFFRFGWYLFSFLWLVVLWILIFRLIKLFGQIHPTAGKLLIPYLIWITFAGYLNLGIYLLNRG